MPKRNDPLKQDRAYWVKQKDGTGYHVWSEEVLNNLIDNGKLNNGEIVQIAQLGTGVTFDVLPV